ncbi:MAG: hypothetical protein ACYC7L_10845 [Nitrospirota bacterium]
MRNILMVLVVLTAVFTNAGAFASVNDDQVTSQKIKEADGMSGQDTNSGSGIKTGHIQDGAVTDTKIGGTISQNKITGLETALAGKSDVTHNHDVLYQQKYGKVTIVAQTGGDYTDPISAMNALGTWCGTPTGTNTCLLKIMPGVYNIGSNSLQMQQYVDIEGTGENTTIISGNVASSTTGVVIGASNSELRLLSVQNTGEGDWHAAMSIAYISQAKISHVTLQSSGPGYGRYGLVNLSAASSIENVSINVSGSVATGITNNSTLTMNNIKIIAAGSNFSFGIVNDDSGSTTMTNTIISVSGGSNGCSGVLNNGSTGTITIRNSAISTLDAGYGVNNASANSTSTSLTITNSTISSAVTGILNVAPGIARISGSTITGITSSISNHNSPVMTYVGVSQLDGMINAASGTIHCYNVYNANL